jgi:hypothetical protein
MGEQPTWTFRDGAAQKPDDQSADGADGDHPTPAVPAERGERHQQIGDQRDNRHNRELHALIERERSATDVPWHQFRDVGVDGDQLHADTDASDHAPQADAKAGALERHDQRGGAIRQHGEGEDRPPSVFVSDKPKDESSDEQAEEGRGDEQRRTREHPDRHPGQKPSLHQSRSDVAGHEQVVELEHSTEGQQRNHQPDVARGR